MEKYNALLMILFYIWYEAKYVMVVYIVAVPSGIGAV